MVLLSGSTARSTSPLSKRAMVTPPNGPRTHPMSSGLTAPPSASPPTTPPSTWLTVSSPSSLSTSPLPPSSSLNSPSPCPPPTSLPRVRVNLRCARTISPPSMTMSSRAALPQSGSSSASTLTPSPLTIFTPDTWSSCATLELSRTSDGRPSPATLAPWSSSGGPAMARTTSRSWTARCQSFAMPLFASSLTLHAHRPSSQSHAFSTVTTSPLWSQKQQRTILWTKPPQTTITMMLDRGQSNFRPPGRCKVRFTADYKD